MIALLVVLLGLTMILLDNNSFVYDTRDPAELPPVRLSEVYQAQDGETIQLQANQVKKEIDGKEVSMFGYNSQIPGTLLKVKEDSIVYVNFTNNLDVPTTVHWHGIRLENANDGVPEMTQEIVKPGKSFLYKLNFPDAGMYWYHPHEREDYQQELGLYGNILVEPKNSDYYNKVNREEVLVFDDILMDAKGIVPFSDKVDHTLMGRFGNVMLVNGQEFVELDAKQGEVIRFYLTNTANTRLVRFVILGVKMKLVGSDGGAYEKESFVDAIILAPSKRAIVEVYFEKPGTYDIKNSNPLHEYTLSKIVVSQEKVIQDFSSEFLKIHENQFVKQEIAPLRSSFGKPADVQLDLSIDMPGMGHMGGMMREDQDFGLEWEDTMNMMNSRMTEDALQWKIIDRNTGKENMDIQYTWKVGDTVKIRIFNDPDSRHPMQHPLHFHGQRFLVLDKDGVRNENLVWEDTVLVPAGSTMDILLEVSNPGEWMAHCHVAEHLGDGMMFSFKVA